MSTYLWVDLGALIVPFLFSFHPRIRFDRMWPCVWPALLVMGLLFIPWDIAFTRSGVWAFDPAHLIGISFIGLPVEEWLFFICIPYACLFTYHCFRIHWMKDRPLSHAPVISWSIAALLALIIVFHPGRTYTTSVFGGSALLLALLQLWGKPVWLGRALVTYLVLLLPFFLVNGILTGMWGDPVVTYDDGEILGSRIGTIPVEDLIYGLSMFLVTVAVYEGRLARRPMPSGSVEHPR